MQEERRYPDTISREEARDILAEATGTDVEEIERAPEEITIAPPWKAEIVDEE